MVKTIIKMGIFLFVAVIGILAITLLLLLFLSPGKPAQFVDSVGKVWPGSISEKCFLQIGGVRQGMFIRSKNIKNPVLLYLHGGPSFPNYFLVDKYNPGLEDFFTVCYWEQRGGGLSYSKDVTPESMTLKQLASDGIEVARYLKERFGKEKVFLIAHSGGTLIALEMLTENPELFHAYIAMAQVTDQSLSEKTAYTCLLDFYHKNGNKRRINQLEKFKVFDLHEQVVSFFKSGLRDQAMHESGIGTMRKMKSVFTDVFIPVWTCKAYTLREKIAIWKSKFTFLSRTGLVNELMYADYSAKYPRLEVPVYFVSGKYDLTVNVDLSKQYFEKLQAPLKRFYVFEESAHSPIFEETENFRKVLVDEILKNFNE